jgi:hypothetical protein
MTDRSATGRQAILKKYDVLPRTYWPGNERRGNALLCHLWTETLQLFGKETFMRAQGL